MFEYSVTIPAFIEPFILCGIVTNRLKSKIELWYPTPKPAVKPILFVNMKSKSFETTGLLIKDVTEKYCSFGETHTLL